MREAQWELVLRSAPTPPKTEAGSRILHCWYLTVERTSLPGFQGNMGPEKIRGWAGRWPQRDPSHHLTRTSGDTPLGLQVVTLGLGARLPGSECQLLFRRKETLGKFVKFPQPPFPFPCSGGNRTPPPMAAGRINEAPCM